MITETLGFDFAFEEPNTNDCEIETLLHANEDYANPTNKGGDKRS